MQPPIHYRSIVELGRAIRTGELTAAAVAEPEPTPVRTRSGIIGSHALGHHRDRGGGRTPFIMKRV